MIKHGTPPYLECSSRGDRRFSAFFAKIKARNNQSIEELYQAAKQFNDGSTGLSIKTAKGRLPVNAAEMHQFYSQLWDEYISENPELLNILQTASGLSDIFGQQNHACQATELWRIKTISNISDA